MEGLRGADLRGIADAVLGLVMPRCCVVCRRPLLLQERFICLSCLSDLPLTHFWERSHNPMSDKFNETIHRSLYPDGEPSQAREGIKENYSYAAALFFYNSDSLYKRIPRHIKYEGGIASGRFFATILGRHLAASEAFADVDLIIPVPLHWMRRWRRGYNQARVIAEAVASCYPSCPPVRTDIIRRRRRTVSQTRVEVQSKSANVRGAFGLCRSFKPAAGGNRTRHILIIDDTFTTGATVNACREALRLAFPPSVRISAATLAFVSSSN